MLTLDSLKEIQKNLESALEGIISGKCKSEGIIYIEDSLEELSKLISKLQNSTKD